MMPHGTHVITCRTGEPLGRDTLTEQFYDFTCEWVSTNTDKQAKKDLTKESWKRKACISCSEPSVLGLVMKFSKSTRPSK